MVINILVLGIFILVAACLSSAYIYFFKEDQFLMELFVATIPLFIAVLLFLLIICFYPLVNFGFPEALILSASTYFVIELAKSLKKIRK